MVMHSSGDQWEAVYNYCETLFDQCEALFFGWSIFVECLVSWMQDIQCVVFCQ